MSNNVNYLDRQEGRSFEAEFAVCCGAAHTITLTNGTMALDLAPQGLGIGVAYGGSAKQWVICFSTACLRSSDYSTLSFHPAHLRVEYVPNFRGMRNPSR